MNRSAIAGAVISVRLTASSPSVAGLVQGACACLWVLPQRAARLPTDVIAISVYTTTDGLYLYTNTNLHAALQTALLLIISFSLR